MVNDPLRFGDLPYQETGERGQTYTRPQPAYIYPPAPVEQVTYGPQPSQQFVDRVQYLQQRLAEMRQRAAQQIAPYQRVQQMTQSLLEQENNRQQAEARQRVQPFLPSGQSTNFGPRSFQDIVDVARTKIPEQVREPVKDFVSQGFQTFASGGPLGRTGMEIASRIPVADKFEDVRQKIVTSASDAAAELVVPREVWEAALELVPGVGTVPDVIKGVREGAPEATRALRLGIEAADAKLAERTGQSLLRGETGAVVPDNVRAMISRRATRNTPKITEQEMQAQWDALPVSTQKLITVMADVVPLGAERRTIVRAGRARQVAKAQSAVEATKGLPADERAQAIAGALKGRIIPGIQPVRSRFEQAEADEIFQTLDNAVDGGKIIGPEYMRAQSAMNLLFYGNRLPFDSGPANLMPHEIKLLGKIYGPAFEAVLPRTKEELSLFEKAVDVLSIPRAIQASIDFSAPGRQGLILGVRNPDYWFQAWKKQFRAALGGEADWQRVGNEIRSDPHFESAVRHGIDFTDIGGGAQAEEAFVSHWVEKLPGISQSGRAYTAFLDYLRLKSYGRMERRLSGAAQKHGWSPERLETALDQAAYFVNVASGRGDLGALNKYTPAMNAMFFSPRFFVSRPQTVWELVKPGVDPAVRQQVFEHVGSFFGIGAGILATLKMTGAAEVELDHRSTDFGKIRVGNQRIDFWGGFQPLARYLAQISMRERKDPYANEDVPTSALEGVQRFIRSKLSPVGAVAWDFLISKGRTYEGKEIVGENPEASVPKYLVDRLTPIGLQDIYEGYTQAGIPGAAGAALSLVGASVQTYDPTARQGAMQKLEQAGINVTYVDDRPVIRVPQLEKDWQSPKWHALFKGDFPELGDTTRFKYVNDLREAYVDYWWKKKGDVTGVGEAQRRRDIGEAFNRAESIKKWTKNEEVERLREWKRHPELLLEAVRSGLESLNQDEEKILRDAGLLPR